MSSFQGRNWALGAAAIVGGATVISVWIIAGEQDSDPGRVGAVIAVFVLAMACAIGGAVLRAPEGRHLAAAAGAGLLLSMGVLAIFSVGSFLLVAAGLLIMSIGAGRTEDRHTPPVLVVLAFAAGAGLPWAVVFAA
ncbi:MAG TPA: hypothetical protein VNC60_05220 [Actinomycetota bacterium]|nr:hypothetical protein [Actinomycetota bacterium]